ncbi:CDC50/LEM3 family [Trypanosoma melophagium]|uniref:CDC50/LEM3 family n=1 Tax=Trypanosoma melophagium TaxID=715481 RepID=UPI00351A5547|nr:CDC50/LEM3 family [Trypanosoma melophagium]
MPEASRNTMDLLRQQRLPAWQPILTPPFVALGFLIVSIIFIPLGSMIAVSNKYAMEVTIRYDDIQHCTVTHNTGDFTYEGNNMTYKTGCLTEVNFEIKKTLKAPIYLYYGLTNFYQNHRRYSNSRSDAQLAGANVRDIPDASPLVKPGEITGTTGTPITFEGNSRLHYKDFVYVPAGLIAWSMFNDTFTLYKKKDSTEEKPELELICNGTDFSKRNNEPLGSSISKNYCSKKGIAWETDVKERFKPPDLEAFHLLWTAERDLYTEGQSSALLSNDSFFNKGWYANELGHAIPVTTDEDLMVWMRTASLPHFRKLHRIIHKDLTPGKYVMKVGEHFDISSFGGTKSFSLATLSWLGGKNTNLAIMYFTVGGIAALFAIILLVAYRVNGDRASKAIEELVQK